VKRVAIRHPSALRPLALVLGTNEIASAIAMKLTEACFAVVMSHDPFPPVIRRGMAFYDCLFGEPCNVEGVVGERADTIVEIVRTHADPRKVAVTRMHLTEVIASRSPSILVEGRMQKRRTTPDLRGIAAITIGVGPQFEVGVNCDVGIETHPAEIGALISLGATKLADGRARTLGGAGRERFVYSDRDGVWHTPVDIGTRVFKGLQLGLLGKMPIFAPMDGTLRGIVRDGLHVPAGVKLLEIDPRGREACWTGMDERGRAIARSVVAAAQRGMLADQEVERVSVHA